MSKFNGPEIERILLTSHLRMRNWSALEKMRTPNVILDNIGVILAIGLVAYMTLR